MATNEEIFAFLKDTIHQEVTGDLKHLNSDSGNPAEIQTCIPGLCGRDPLFPSVCRLVRAFHTSLTERKINTGSLLLVSCVELPSTYMFFLGVTLKKPLRQTVLLACIEEDRVSLQLLGGRNVPDVTTTARIFLKMLRCVANGETLQLKVEHWLYEPFVDSTGALQVNAESIRDTFEFNASTKAFVPKKPVVKMPFGFKPDRQKRKTPDKDKSAAGPPKRKATAGKPQPVDFTTDTGDGNIHCTDSGNDNDNDNFDDFDFDNSSDSDEVSKADHDEVGVADSFVVNDIEPINEVVRQETAVANEVAEEVRVADEAKDMFAEEVLQEHVQESSSSSKKKAGNAPAAGSSFFSKELGMGVMGVSPTNRAKCYSCKEMIAKGSVRVEWSWNKLRPPGWLHSYCLPALATKFELKNATLGKLQEIANQATSSMGDDPVQQEAKHLHRVMSSS